MNLAESTGPQSRWVAYTDDMTVIEDNGIAPHIAMAPANSFNATSDYVLERAMAELGSPVK